MHYNYGYSEGDSPGTLGDLRLWRRIGGYAAPYRRHIAGALVLACIISGAGLTLPYLVGIAIDNYIVNRDQSPDARLAGLTLIALPFACLAIIAFLANYFQITLLEKAGQNTMHRIRQALFQHMLNLDVSFFNHRPTGRLVTRLTNDIQNMHEMFTSVIVTLFNDLIRILGILVVLFLLNHRLGALVALFLPAIILLTISFSRYARQAFHDIRFHLAGINGFLQEHIKGIIIIRIFSRQDEARRKFTTRNRAYYLSSLHQIKIFGIFVPLIEIFSTMAVSLIIWYGGGQIIMEKMSIGVLVAFLSYMKLFFQPLRELSQKYSLVQSAMASAERIFNLLDTQISLPVPAAPLTPQPFQGEIRFRNVTFGYTPTIPVLRNFSLTVRPGEALAIVGATGAGKSTVINLLERFYDPDEGGIELDGIDLKNLDSHWLREQIGLVMQEVNIIAGTVEENILLGRRAEPQYLARLIKEAQLADMVAGLPQGLKTKIGAGGMDLSVGQKQLIALARVLARNAKILVLDEATANVDTITETLVQRAIAKIIKNRTSIVIAHRLSTIRRADRILVMAEGRVIEEGTHRELMVRQGHYFHLQSLAWAKNLKI